MEITLNTNNVDFSVLNDTLERYSEINSEYRKNKKKLRYEKSKVGQSKNGLFSFFGYAATGANSTIGCGTGRAGSLCVDWRPLRYVQSGTVGAVC